MSDPTVVAQRSIVTDSHRLTVSTLRFAPGDYETTMWDDSDDKRHTGRQIGRLVVDCSSVWSGTRDEALRVHRNAVLAAREAAGGAS